ncbi:hypothetical protein CYMTET_19434 [Cymbomonas tetramitiformis]|uniref:CST complex subunit TEN1 n=1 Tax=Cymbomonas tetramitiformis TaxID=36881 RepID=A0AAE0G7D6_9CHLO|nr:hypothetical protein CYMTET_19434 [Cymbomonas tetramitiformis]
MQSIIGHSEIVQIHELFERSQFFEGKSVRVTGRLKKLDALTGEATISQHSLELAIDTSYLRGVSLLQGSMFQIIGDFRLIVNELRAKEGGDLSGVRSDDLNSPRRPLIQARIARNVDGIDMQLYEQALGLRRTYLANRN